jgi:hypothetical protein
VIQILLIMNDVIPSLNPLSACKLPDNYQTWFSVTALHLWMVIVRLRPETHGEIYNETLINTFFEDMEWRMCNIYGVSKKASAHKMYVCALI